MPDTKNNDDKKENFNEMIRFKDIVELKDNTKRIISNLKLLK